MTSKFLENLIDKFKKEEEKFLAATFLAPVLKKGAVQTRIAGVVRTMEVSPADFEGWGILRVTEAHKAEVIGEADLKQIKMYLKQFSPIRIILVQKRGGIWFGYSVNRSDAKQRFGLRNALLPVFFVDRGNQFNQIKARFDGRNFWFESEDASHDPQIASYLRGEFAKRTSWDKVHFSTLTPEERSAYKAAVDWVLAEEKGYLERKLEQALGHAGGRLIDYTEQGKEIVVRWKVGESETVSRVKNSGSFGLITAGICLSGEDQKFDLTSLVSIVADIEEGREEGFRDDRDYVDNDDYDDYDD